MDFGFVDFRSIRRGGLSLNGFLAATGNCLLPKEMVMFLMTSCSTSRLCTSVHPDNSHCVECSAFQRIATTVYQLRELDAEDEKHRIGGCKVTANRDAQKTKVYVGGAFVVG